MATDFLAIKCFSELRSHPGIAKVIHWDEYVAALNAKNPHFYDGLNSTEYPPPDAVSCSSCNHSFTPHTDPEGLAVPITVDFLYKHWKCDGRWHDEHLCSACFYAFQNPRWSRPKGDLDYNGEMVCDGGRWEWADRRDCDCDDCEKRREYGTT